MECAAAPPHGKSKARMSTAAKVRSLKVAPQIERTTYLFLDRAKGGMITQFQSDVAGVFPLEKAAAIMALQGVSRHRHITDFMLVAMVPAETIQAVDRMANNLLGELRSQKHDLSRREMQVLNMVCENLANKEIAARMNVSERTVKFHVSALLAKYGVRNRVALTMLNQGGIDSTAEQGR
jgi:DNA-binding CsgD family transcriptional regulator